MEKETEEKVVSKAKTRMIEEMTVENDWTVENDKWGRKEYIREQ